ncbi:hypothetical protein H1C71_034036 [Ictidomys tridecemlineatus]|nr:hypothetical protein H1C71_034036 [Ictidomys tridecemlineatus]
MFTGESCLTKHSTQIRQRGNITRKQGVGLEGEVLLGDILVNGLTDIMESHTRLRCCMGIIGRVREKDTYMAQPSQSKVSPVPSSAQMRIAHTHSHGWLTTGDHAAAAPMGARRSLQTRPYCPSKCLLCGLVCT